MSLSQSRKWPWLICWESSSYRALHSKAILTRPQSQTPELKYNSLFTQAPRARRGRGARDYLPFVGGLGTWRFVPAAPRRRGPDAAPARLCKMPRRGYPEGSCRCTPPCCPTDLHARTRTHRKALGWSACWAKGSISNRPCHCYLNLAWGSNRTHLSLLYPNPAESLYTL